MRDSNPTPVSSPAGGATREPSEKAWELMREFWNTAQDNPTGSLTVYAAQALANYIADLESRTTPASPPPHVRPENICPACVGEGCSECDGSGCAFAASPPREETGPTPNGEAER